MQQNIVTIVKNYEETPAHDRRMIHQELWRGALSYARMSLTQYCIDCPEGSHDISAFRAITTCLSPFTAKLVSSFVGGHVTVLVIQGAPWLPDRSARPDHRHVPYWQKTTSRRIQDHHCMFRAQVLLVDCLTVPLSTISVFLTLPLEL